MRLVLVGPVTIYIDLPLSAIREDVGASSAPGGVVSEEVAEELPAALRGALAADGEALLKELQLPGSHHRAHHHQLRALYPGAAAE